MLIQITVHNRGPEAAELQLLPTLWFRNRWSWGTTVDRPTAAPDRLRADGRIVIGADDRSWASVISIARAAPSCCSRRTRPTPSASSAPPTAAPTSRTASTTMSSTARRARSTRTRRGTKAAAHYRLTLAPGRSKRVRLRLTASAPDRARAKADARPFGEGFDDICRLGAPRPTNSTPPSPRQLLERRAGPRHAPGAGRHAVEQAVLLLRRGQMARGARRRSLQADAGMPRRATTNGTTCTTPTSSRCRTNGNIPGMRRGTSPSTCWR